MNNDYLHGKSCTRDTLTKCMLKSQGFKKTLVDSCQAPGRSCQLNENQRTQQLLNFCLDFLSSSKTAQKFKCSRHLARLWHLSGSLFLNPYDFKSSTGNTTNTPQFIWPICPNPNRLNFWGYFWKKTVITCPLSMIEGQDLILF